MQLENGIFHRNKENSLDEIGAWQVVDLTKEFFN